MTTFLTRRQTLRAGLACLVSPTTLPALRMAAKRPAVRFRVSFSSSISEKPYTGRVYLFFNQSRHEPRLEANWFSHAPILVKDVVHLRPGEHVELSPDDPDTQGYPQSFRTWDYSNYNVQAMFRLNPWERSVTKGPGNGLSRPQPLETARQPCDLVADQLIPARKKRENRWFRVFEVPSDRLSQFHKRPVSVRAGILLPNSYDHDRKRRYPVIFNIPGFGGTHIHGYRDQPIVEQNRKNIEFLRVTLDPSCPLGHHVFADSANNGPWGKALTEEFLPAFEQSFRTLAEPSGRLLTGHSSGGWSSLWLQITYPELFGGVWSTAPDPVDFRDFQRINLYRPGENMYVDPQGNRRPLARHGKEILLWYDDFARKEEILGPGGQLHSFEAVFSQRTPAGTPQRLWNRETGEIDLAVAQSWVPFDIRRKLENNWHLLEPLLQGKLHIFTGEEDTFYLEGAVRLLKQSLAQRGSDAVVEIHPGRDHANLMTRQLRDRIRSEMVETVLQERHISN